MKKIYLPFAASLALFSWVSCNDQGLSDDSLSVLQKAAVIDPAQDLTFGNDLFISGIDTLSDQRIELNVDSPVEVTSRDGKITFKCVEEGGRYYLQPQMLVEAEELSVLDKVTLRVAGNPSLDKSLYVSVRQDPSTAGCSTRAVSATATRLGELFSFGIYPNHEIGEVIARYPTLDHEIVEKNVTVISTFTPATTYTEAGGNTLDEVNKSWGIAAGMDNIPIPNGSGKVGGSLGYKSTEKSKNYYQYSTRTRKSELAAGSIDYTDANFPTYISDQLNKVLNTNERLSTYPNTAEGIFKILDDYGPYVPTFCIMGASASYVLSKKQDLEMSGDEWEGQLKGSFYGSEGEANIKGFSKDQLDAYKYVSENAPSVKANFNYSKQKVLDNSDFNITTTLLGGNAATAKGIEDFNAGDDPAKWIALAYSGKGQTAQLVPLYKFCVDQNSERCRLLKKYIDGDSYEEYYKHRKEYIEIKDEETEWVLAGLKLVVTEDEQFAPFEDECADGVRRTYYPMMFNSRCSYYSGYHGEVLDTQIQKFGRCGRSRQHVWYYALAMHDDCPGLKEIKFSNGYGSYEYNCMKPDYANTGTGWACSTKDDSKLVVVPISKDDKTTRPITAFALYDEDGNIFASTGGTEYASDVLKRQNFLSFWDNDETRHYVKKVNNNPSKYGIYHLKWIHQPVYLYYMYSTQPLSMKLDGKKYMIKHPNNMKKGTF